MKKKLLIIDDDAELCKELIEIFDSEGYNVTCIFNGDDIEKTIAQSEFHIILLDFKMPGLNGIEALRAIKEKSRESKILIATGRPYIEDLLKREGLFGAVGGIFVKPYKPELLIEKIKTF
ncbi:MAG: response regulator [Candidatus Omnitrophica bacterium]|nr:response regulator [Candidatus Omnitrophota bacterium]MDD5552251.1 response regulator [Candidatus Omnitrophota bacterium]